MNAPATIPPPPLAADTDAPKKGRSAKERELSHSEPARPVPATRRIPIVGPILAMRKKGMLGMLLDEWQRHGDVFRLKLGPTSAVVVAHPDGLERILASHLDFYTKGAAYDGLRSILGNGLIAARGKTWRKQRSLLQPSFHRAGLQSLVGSMVTVASGYFDDLKARFPEGGEIDAHREMTKLTLDIVIGALFGPGLASSDDISYETVLATLELVSERSNNYNLPLIIPTPGNLRFKRVLAELDAVIYSIIKKARAQHRETEESGKHRLQDTLLDMLLDAVDAETGQPLPDVMVRDELLTLFVAGHETTALTVTWLFTLLDGEEEVIEKMRAECAAVLGDRLPSFEDLPQLKYIRQVIDEALRLRGPVAIIARNVVKDDNLLGFRVKAGEMIIPFFYGAHRHPDFWDNPERFDPERFNEENSQGRDRFCYLPFSAGQRVCIGNSFSLFETQLILALLVTRCDFKMVAGQDIRPEVIATVRPSAPVKIRIDWR